MIKHYINVNEKDSAYYIEDSNYSSYIGFVYDTNKDKEYGDNNFGYIIANNKQFGLSYYTLSNYLTDVQNKCIEHSMMYHTNELLNCSQTDHNAFLNEIRVSKSILNTYFINSVTIKLRTVIDKEKTGATTPAYMIIRDRNEVGDNSITNTKLLACSRSINSIVQSDYANKYVTFYFDHVIINTSNNSINESSGRYGFRLIDANGNTTTMQCHVKDMGAEQWLICMSEGRQQFSTWQPAFGVNVANMFNVDVANSILGGKPITWNSETLRLSYFTENGNYIIKGEHESTKDDLPIMNANPGHTIYGHLQVLNSSLTNGTGADTDCSVTQILNLSNRHGGDGHIYVRSGNAASIVNLRTDASKWGTWEKLMGIFEKNIITNISDINNYTTNGMYSGIYAGGADGVLSDTIKIPHKSTFLIITVNGYVAGGIQPTDNIVQITQLIYILPVATTNNYDNHKPKLYIRHGHWNNDTWTWSNGDRLITSSEFDNLEKRVYTLEHK